MRGSAWGGGMTGVNEIGASNSETVRETYYPVAARAKQPNMAFRKLVVNNT